MLTLKFYLKDGYQWLIESAAYKQLSAVKYSRITFSFVADS